MSRGDSPTLPGGLHLHEFEILVRNEWRRRLGPEACDRAHEVRLVRTLAEVAQSGAGANPESDLLQAMEAVLTKAGADPDATAPILRSVRRVLEGTMGYSLD